jgi:3-hydroxyisobutyrate dehydrogenase
MNDPVVAVIGLGAMGLPMAVRLAERLEVRGTDVAPARRQLAAESGVTACASVAEAVTGAGVILVVVRDQAQCEAVLDGLTGAAKGSVVLLASTIGVEPVRAAARRLDEHGIAVLDTPLSGGPVRARRGDLLIVVGGPDDRIEAVRPVLDQLATTVSVVGPAPGDGQALKTVNQLLCGVHIAAAAEAMALAAALGLDPARCLEALNAGAAASFMLADRGRRMVSILDGAEPEVLSRLDIFVKDLGIVADAARARHVPTPVAAAAEQLFRLGEAAGLGDSDDSAAVTLLRSGRQPAAEPPSI